MDLGLAGKTAIVTGGASNIGRATVLAFAGEGANIVIADMDEKQARKTADDANALNGNAIVIEADVGNRESVEAMVNGTLNAFGSIEVLVNNVSWANQGPFLVDKQDEEVEKEIRLNFWNLIYCSRAVARHMIERKYGKIINLGSGAGRTGTPGGTTYSALKSAVIGFTKALARELGRYEINVNCVCPGVVVPSKPEDAGEGSFWSSRVTEEWTPEYLRKLNAGAVIRRFGDPGDIANMIVFLSSDCASYVTGQTISVDGGSLMM